MPARLRPTCTWLSTLPRQYGLHILEEYTFDWRNWARNVLSLPVERDLFQYVTTPCVSRARRARRPSSRAHARSPSMLANSPSSAACMLIRSLSHFLHDVGHDDRSWSTARATASSPGASHARSACLFYPVGVACFRRAAADGDLDGGHLGRLAAARGGADGRRPSMMLKLKDRPYFPPGPALRQA